MKAKHLGMKVQPLRANPADFVPNVIGLNGVTSITKMNLSLSLFLFGLVFFQNHRWQPSFITLSWVKYL